MTPEAGGRRIHRRYLTMRDGCRIAITTHLPAAKSFGPSRPSNGELPAIIHQTRYHREVAWTGLARTLGVHDSSLARTRRLFLDAGFAWVDVDVRGSGASFGYRPCPWSENERQDAVEIVDWIVAQPWSNGRVGAMGTSYAGTCAEFLGMSGHPAVRAVAPLFSLYDVYDDVALPGGIQLSWFTQHWARANAFLDQNRRDQAAAMVLNYHTRVFSEAFGDTLPRGARQTRRFRNRVAVAALEQIHSWALESPLSAVVRPLDRGVLPVDPADHETFRAAIASHADNENVHLGASRIIYRDDRGMHAKGGRMAADEFSPHHLAAATTTSVPTFSVSGWMDGGYCRSAVRRFNAQETGERHLVLGAWDHGGGEHISPHSNLASDYDPVVLLEFFSRHLLEGSDSSGGSTVKYYVLGLECWRHAANWPPPHQQVALNFATDRSLALQKQRSTAEVTWKCDPTATTGTRTRWRSLLRMLTPLRYNPRAQAVRRWTFTSPPTKCGLEVAGSPLVELMWAGNRSDAALFVYLEDVGPTGDVTYVTEGMLRAIHRKTVKPNDTAAPSGQAVVRSFLREDGRRVEPGVFEEVALALLPIAYWFAPGHRVRVSIASADVDQFADVDDAATEFALRIGGESGSRVILPVTAPAQPSFHD